MRRGLLALQAMHELDVENVVENMGSLASQTPPVSDDAVTPPQPDVGPLWAHALPSLLPTAAPLRLGNYPSFESSDV